MVLAIPGGRGLFSQLQSMLLHAKNPKPTDRLRLSQPVHDQLDDFRWLAHELTARPTHWAEVVDSAPTFLRTVDASGLGMAGLGPASSDSSLDLLLGSLEVGTKVLVSSDGFETEVGPDIPVGGSCSLSAEREAGSQCCIHKAFVAVEINAGREWQSRQDCVCG
jgi:hypothetical protein